MYGIACQKIRCKRMKQQVCIRLLRSCLMVCIHTSLMVMVFHTKQIPRILLKLVMITTVNFMCRVQIYIHIKFTTITPMQKLTKHQTCIYGIKEQRNLGLISPQVRIAHLTVQKPMQRVESGGQLPLQFHISTLVLWEE